MGKKEPSKGREWEKGRRDILNQAFHELYKALPSYSDGICLSKKTILNEALAYIQELESRRKSCICFNHTPKKQSEQSVQSQKSASLMKWILEMVNKVEQLASLLKASGINPPQQLVSFEDPPVLSDKLCEGGVPTLGKIGSIKNLKHAPSNKAVYEKKPKADFKSKQSQGAAKSNSGIHSLSLKKGTCADTKGTTSHTQDGKMNGLTASANFIQSNPVVVQPSAPLLPSQIVFTPNSSNNSMATSLPLLVSVTGVKTVNPLILVQSNVMAQSPSLVYTHPRLTPANSQARPIQPGPPSKTHRKLKKIPIPSLKQKTIVPMNVCAKSAVNNSNNESDNSCNNSLNNMSAHKNKKLLKSRTLLKIVSRRKSKTSQCLEKLDKACLKSSSKSGVESHKLQSSENNGVTASENVEASNAAISVMHGDYGVPEINKENVALNGETTKLDCDSSKTSNFTPFSTSTCNIVQEKDDGPIKEKGISQDSIQQAVSEDEVAHDSVCTANKTSGHTMEEKSGPSVVKRTGESEVSLDDAKRSKNDTSSGMQDLVKPTSNITAALQHAEEISSSSSPKIAKTNYSISALCAQQQHLMQQSQVSPMHGPVPLDSAPSRSPEALVHDSRADVTNLPEPLENRNPQEHCLNPEKHKDLVIPTSDHFIEWSEKSKGKGERLYSSYTLFSNFAAHSNKNSFIPISDMDNYKAIPDSFDASENSFGLPLNASDISGDIFASLQVPPGSQHPESISPTAAFLLAFPLVSSSKATELLSEDAVCENTDSQSGMKTILQIGNMEGDTPVTKCVSVFPTSSAETSSIVYSTPNLFSHDALTEVLPKPKGMDSSTEINFSQKAQNMVAPKMQVGSSKPNSIERGYQIPLSKGVNQMENRDGSKHSCQSRNNSGVEDSAFSTLEVQSGIVETSSRMQDKNMGKHSTVISTSSSNDSHPKNSLKSSSTAHHSQETTPFLTCQKQQDWSEVSATSQAVHSFTDFSTLSSTRTDCAINFPIPPTITGLTITSNSSSDMVSAVSGPSYRAQPSSNNSILSWSTIPAMETSLTDKSHKLAPFQDTFPSTKAPDKHDHCQSTSVVLCSNMPNSEPSYSQQLSSSGFHIGDKVNSNMSHFNQDPSNSIKIPFSSTSYGHGLVMDQKQSSTAAGFSVSSKRDTAMSFSTVNKAIDSKKPYQSDSKQNSNTSEIGKASSGTASNLHCSHQQSELTNETTQVSSSGLIFAPSDGHQKSRNIPCNQGGVTGINHSHPSKLSGIVPHFSQNASAQQEKAIESTSQYKCHNSDSIGKESLGHNPVMNIYENGSNNQQKQNESVNNQCSHNVSGTVDRKKGGSHFNQHITLPLSKHGASVPSYNVNLDNSGPQFTDNLQETVNGPQQTYKMISHDLRGKQQNSDTQLQLQQRQAPQQLTQQNCVRSNKESSASMMHRPPVNWMTAPDIRSHQHHNGPAFGNGSNMTSTQGILYLPDSENGGPSSVFDSSSNFHCLDITHSGQSLYKGNELHLFGNEGLENIHENSSWSPNKSGSSSMLGNMLIPSTLPTLVGDLALGDNSIPRPFFSAFGNTNEPVPCPNKKSKRVSQTSKRGEKTEELHVSHSQECSGSFLSVSQLVDSGSVTKNRNASLKESVPCSSHFPEQNNALCHTSKQSQKSVSSNYSTEALLSSSSLQQSTQSTYRKRRTPGTSHYHNNYITPGASFHNTNNNALQTQVSQSQFIPDIGTSRANDYQGTFIPTDSVPVAFMIGASSKSQRNHTYNLTNVAERPPVEDQPSSDRNHHSSTDSNETNSTSSAVRQRPVTINSNTPSSSSNIMDFGYINMQSTMLSDDLSFPNHHPPPPFLPHHSYTAQDTLYTAPRLPMHTHHPTQNNSVQSPSATTLTNFHLSTIFPEINEKVIC